MYATVTAEWAMERDGLGCRKVHERRKEREGEGGWAMDGWWGESAKANMTISIDGERATRESAKNCIAAERAADGSVAGETRERMTSSRWNVKIVFGPSSSLSFSLLIRSEAHGVLNPKTSLKSHTLGFIESWFIN